jgi:membrane protein implicated in regulation of membrane protease activity
MAIAMGSQHRSLGSAAALLGGMMMTIAGAATPLAAKTSTAGAAEWTVSLLVIAAVVCVLSILSAKTNANDSKELAAH